jgi:hypothetical protein
MAHYPDIIHLPVLLTTPKALSRGSMTFPSRVAPHVCRVSYSLFAVRRCRIIPTSSTSYFFSLLNPHTSDKKYNFQAPLPFFPVSRYSNKLSHYVKHLSATPQLPSLSLPSKLFLNTAPSYQEEASQHPLHLPGPIPKFKPNNYNHKITDPP